MQHERLFADGRAIVEGQRSLARGHQVPVLTVSACYDQQLGLNQFFDSVDSPGAGFYFITQSRFVVMASGTLYSRGSARFAASEDRLPGDRCW